MKPAPLFSLVLILLVACAPAASVFPPTASPASATAPTQPTAEVAATATSAPPRPTATPSRPTATPSRPADTLAPSPAIPTMLERRDLAVITPANLAKLELLVAFRPGPPEPVNSLLFFPNHNHLVFALGEQPAASGRSLPIYVWNLAQAQPVQILDSASTTLSGLALSPDAALLAFSGDGPLRLWNTTTWQAQTTPEQPNLPAALAFAPEGWLAYGFRGDGRLAAWQPVDTTERWIVLAHDLDITALAVSARSDRIATAGLDGSLSLWKAANGDDDATLAQQAGIFTHLSFTPDDQLLLSYEKSGVLRAWRTSNYKPAYDLKACSSGLPGCTALGFSPDRRLLALNDPARQDSPGIHFFDPLAGAPLSWLDSPSAIDPGRIASLAFSADGRLLAIGSSDGQIQLWGVTGGLFALGAALRVAEAGDGLNLRDRPALGGSIRSQLSEGETLDLLEGPLLAEGYNWWRIRTGQGREGWIVEVSEWFTKGE